MKTSLFLHLTLSFSVSLRLFFSKRMKNYRIKRDIYQSVHGAEWRQRVTKIDLQERRDFVITVHATTGLGMTTSLHI